jgi:hypothetical protein
LPRTGDHVKERDQQIQEGDVVHHPQQQGHLLQRLGHQLIQQL